MSSIFNSLMVNQSSTPKFTKLYSYYYGYRKPVSGEDPYFWDTSEGFTVPGQYSTTPVIVEVNQAVDVTATVTSSYSACYTVTKIQTSDTSYLFLIYADFGYSTSYTTEITFSITGGESKTYKLTSRNHHLSGYATDDWDMYDLTTLKGSMCYAASTSASYAEFRVINRLEDTESGSYLPFYGDANKKVQFASDGLTAQNYNFKGALVTATYNDSVNTYSAVDTFSGADFRSKHVFNTDSAFTVTVTHPDDNPDDYLVRVNWQQSSDDHYRFFLVYMPSAYSMAPIFIYQPHF